MQDNILENILAKSNPPETLISHTENALQKWNELYERYKDIIKDCEFWKHSYLSVLFHDFGKITNNFQNVIQGKSSNKYDHIRHEFISGMYLYYIKSDKSPDNTLMLFAIFSHHKPLNDNIFQGESFKNLSIDKNLIDKWNFFVLEKCKKKEINLCIKEGFSKYFAEEIDLEKLYNKFFNLTNPGFYQRITSLSISDRKKYIMYKAILNISDWYALSNNKIPTHLDYNLEFLKKKITNKLIEEKKINNENDFKFRKFQTDSIKSDNIIAIAPTGSGKTEASLLWASTKDKYSKIFYLLPTRVTSNSIYNRIKKYFGDNEVSLIHSSAFYVIKDEDTNYNKLEYLKDKTFFKSVNICTIDQVLTQGFNFGYWELKTFNMLEGKVIIDEIHIYQPYTLGLLISTIKYLKEYFDCQFYIMSATMPEKLIGLFKKTIPDATIIKDEELLNEARNIFEVRENYFDGIFDEILKNIDNGKKILIVVNTVNEAIRIYDKIKNNKNINNIFCYHSRFIQKDRIDKEKKIIDKDNSNESFVLVATQVVEVSLDIDFDILYTENAPIDAIIQRAGRVNRKRKKDGTKVIIFKHSELTEKYVYDNKDILDKTFNSLKENNGKKLTEKDLISLVDNVYNDFNIENDESYKKGLNIYDEIQKQNCYIKDNLSDESIFTREGLDTISVIPYQFFESLKDKSIEEKVKYEVSIRKTSKYCLEKDSDGFIYIKNINYTYEKGLEFTGINRNTNVELSVDLL